jgi:hypothetical protein
VPRVSGLLLNALFCRNDNSAGGVLRLFHQHCCNSRICYNIIFTMSGIPQTLITGSIAYLVAAVVLIGLVQAARGVGKLNKDDAG